MSTENQKNKPYCLRGTAYLGRVLMASNYPGFHRRRFEVARCRAIASLLAKNLDQSRRVSLGLAKIAVSFD